MTLKETGDNLLELPGDYNIVHCISAERNFDNGLRSAIDKKYNLKETMAGVVPDFVALWDSERMDGSCIMCNGVFNLVTRRSEEDAVTYRTFENALVVMRKICGDNPKYHKLAIARESLKELGNVDKAIMAIVRVFFHNDIEILLVR